MKKNEPISQELLELVERYHINAMPEQERLEFERRMEHDPDFKLVVEDLRAILSGIEAQSLKEQLEEFHKELPRPKLEQPQRPNRLRLFGIFGIAATIILTLGIFWFLREPFNQRLYAQYFTPDPGLPTTMSSTDNFEFFDAMVNYKQGDYQKAISKWEILEKKAPDNDTLNYFLGVAYLANKNEAQAISYLNKTVNASKSVFMEDAHYYLGLAYLKSDQVDKAKQSFLKSSSDKSKRILNELE